MTLKRAVVVLAMLAAACPCWAQRESSKVSPSNSAAPAAAAPSAAPKGAPVIAPVVAPANNMIAPADPAPGTLAPRKALPKAPSIKKPSGNSRLIVKFRDDLKFRAAADRMSLVSLAAADVSEVANVANQFNLKFIPAINKSETELTSLQARAAANSHKAQPDLGGMMYIDGAESVLQSAAQELLALNSVEFAYFEVEYVPYGAIGACCVAVDGMTNCVADVTLTDCETQGGFYEGDGSTCAGLPGGVCPVLGACCLIDQTCVPLTDAQCAGLGGNYKGDGTNCVLDTIDCTNVGCGDPANGTCFLPHDGLLLDPPPGPYCDNVDCCNLVGSIRDFCINPMGGNWDEICVALAQLLCDSPPADRCLSPINGNCFAVHPSAGCIDSVCCYIVCAIDPFCCQVEWDAGCVAYAEDNCILPGGGAVTPDFTAQQGYLRRTSYADQPGGVPLGLSPPAPVFTGFTGEGWYLFDDSELFDHPDITPTSVRFAGLYGLGRQLKEIYHIGSKNQARGSSVKVAVIEWAFYKGHEDLDVVSEPGQTLIMIPNVTHPSHATACLGIINGKDNGFGIVGVAPDAKAYFFPLTSVEEGPRFLTAFINCYDSLGLGDVVSCSFGPGGSNINNEGAMFTLISMGSDLGITTCLAAGNSCRKLDTLPSDLGDSSAIVVGAGSPGVPYFRLVFSNHFEDLPVGDSRHVDVQAWGECVTSTGGSPNLFFPGSNWNRSYTSGFNGTSSATPQIAGLVACMQGLAKQFFGVALTPGQMRTAIVADAYPQQGVPDPTNLPGFRDNLGCALDFDPQEQPNRIGPYPQPELAGADMFAQSSTGFDQAPMIDDVLVIRGILDFGNVFSIKAADNNFLVVSTLMTDRHFHPNIPGPAGQVTYLATAQTADIMVTGHANSKTASAITVNTEIQVPEVPSITFLYLYDWVTGKWNFIDFAQLPGDDECADNPDQCNTFQSTAFPTRFINQSNHNVLIRIYTMGLGGPPMGPNQGTPLDGSFPVRIDWVNMDIATGFGQGGIGTPPPPP